MGEENNNSSEIESELYALISTISNLYDKYQHGIINTNFFQKSIKNSINNLLKLNFLINENKIILSQLLKKMNLTQDYKRIIEIINEVSALDLSENFTRNEISEQNKSPKKIKASVLELPGITVEITSSFITIMDALKLKRLKDAELVSNLFNHLISNIKKFPGIENIQFKVEDLYQRIQKNPLKVRDNTSFSELLVDELYKIFKEFQNKLNLKNS